jgi:hypothetical protein
MVVSKNIAAVCHPPYSPDWPLVIFFFLEDEIAALRAFVWDVHEIWEYVFL